MRIALAGNPNSGKTTLFNQLTGANQFVGNWPGVTVERKSGLAKRDKDVEIVDLPGIYSLSPYTLEEEVTRGYLIDETPDAIINIVDGSNLERNLYLTLQLLELGIPMVVAVNMMDVVQKRGDTIDLTGLAQALGCPVTGISAMHGDQVAELLVLTKKVAVSHDAPTPVQQLSPEVETVLEQLSDAALQEVEPQQRRWFAVKLLEQDALVHKRLGLGAEDLEGLSALIRPLEAAREDDAESIVTTDRYDAITKLLDGRYLRAQQAGLSVSDKIDRVMTNKWLALPIFVLIMFSVYFLAVHPNGIGTKGTDWVNDGVFGEGFSVGSVWVPGLPGLISEGLQSINVHPDLHDLVIEGIVAGVGGVLGFLPMLIVLFVLLALLESIGYMVRIAFILDRIFRRFGLSGKSMIPMLIGTGCSVPGIMAARTIENDKDRRITVMTTSFIPCGAKLPVIALIAGAFFRDQAWVAPVSYFIGIAAVVVSGVILKKTKRFASTPSPFVIELPAYHLPRIRDVLRSTWDRTLEFIRRAGTIILLSSIFIWLLSAYGFDGGFRRVPVESSLLANIGSVFAWVFRPLGWGRWQAAVAMIMGLVAKENIVGTFGILYGFAEVAEDGQEVWAAVQADFTTVAAFSFLVFNLLCAPCFAAVGAIRREMQSPRWTAFALVYQTVFAYLVAFVIYQVGAALTGSLSILGLAIAIVVILVGGYFLVRSNRYQSEVRAS